MINKQLDKELFRKIVRISNGHLKKKETDKLSKSTTVDNMTKDLMKEVRNYVDKEHSAD